MADISTELQKIVEAVYGEDVRWSIHDAIEKINDVSEVVFSTGTAIDSATSSSTGYYTDSIYLNTNTYEIWKCVGVDSWQSLGSMKGADGEDGAPGTPGADGNKWYRGTGISGKAVNPTVYSGSGITNANPNDFYLNPSEGAVYHCVTGGDASTATWSYDFTMTGGGGGSTVTWTQIVQTGTQIATIDIDGSPQNVYAPQGGGSSTFAGLDDTDISSPQDNQIVQYATVSGNKKLQNVTMDASPTQSSAKPVTSGGVYTALSNKANNSALDEWTSAVQVDNNNQVTFTGLNDAYGYDLYCEDKLISVTALTKSGSGTNVTAVYTVIGATAGTDYCKLRVLK